MAKKPAIAYTRVSSTEQLKGFAADFRNSPRAIIEIPQLIDPVSCVI